MWLYFSTTLFIDRCAHKWVNYCCTTTELIKSFIVFSSFIVSNWNIVVVLVFLYAYLYHSWLWWYQILPDLLCVSQRLDINGDGEVSPSELRKALKFMNIRVDKAVCTRMVYEFNAEGFLDIDIFMGIVTDLFRNRYLDPETVRSVKRYVVGLT